MIWEEQEREKEKRHQEWQAEYSAFRQQRLEEVTAYVWSLNNEQIREELIKSLMKEFDNNYPDDDEYFYEDEEDYYF